MARSTQSGRHGDAKRGDKNRIRRSSTSWSDNGGRLWQGPLWLVLAGLSVAVALVAVGCGKSDSPPPAAQTPPPDMAPPGMPPGEQPPAGQPPPGMPAAGPSATPSGPGGASPQAAPAAQPGAQPAEAQSAAQAKAEPKKPQKPLPEKITDWKPEDYLRARREGDPRLKDAVKLLAQQNAGGADANQADKAVELLSRLLKPEEFQPPPGAKPSAGPGSPPAGGPPPGSPPGPPPGEAPPAGSPSPSAPPSQPTSERGSSASSAAADLVTPAQSLPEATESVTLSQNPATPASTESPASAASPAPGPGGPGPGMPGAEMPGMGMPGPGVPGQPGQEPGYRALDAQTIRAIVEAIAEIGNRSAQQQLAALIAGRLKTDDDRAATEVALECLVTHSRPEYEAMLFAVLTAPEKVRPSDKPVSQTPGATPQQPGGMTPQPGSEPAVPPQSFPGAPGMGPGGGRVTADEIQRKALSLVETTASEAFRLKLANHLIEASTPETQRALLGKFLMEDRPENVAAQVVIFGSPMASAQVKATLEAYFLRSSSYALARILGIPPEQISAGQPGPGGTPFGQPGPAGPPPEQMQPMAPGAVPPGAAPPGAAPAGAAAPGQGASSFGSTGTGAPGMPGMSPSAGPQGMPGAPGSPGAMLEKKEPDPDLPFHIAQLLWGPKFSDAIQARLEAAESLDKAAAEIAWASTIPTTSMRSALYETLYKHAGKGAQALFATGALDRVASDPGFVIVVKSMPRKDVPTGRTAAGGADPGRTAGDSSRAKGGGMFADKMAALRKAKQERDQTEGEWMRASEDVVRTLCRRLFAAAKAREKPADATDSAEPSESAASRPVDLPKGVAIAAEYHLTWPGPYAKKLADVPRGPFRLYYARVETKSRPTLAVAFFKRKVSQPVIHQTELGLWLESFRTLPKTNRKMSIDVLVSRAEDLAAKTAPGGGIGGPPAAPPPGGGPAESSPMGALTQKAAARAAAAAEEAGDLVIEVLTLEMRDPGPETEEKE